MTVKLKNQTQRMVVFNLPHESVCTEEKCLCARQVTGVQQHDAATGEKTVQALKRRLASSVTLAAQGTDGDTADGLPDGVLGAPDVRAAIKARMIGFESSKLEAAKAAEEEANRADAATTVAPLSRAAKKAPTQDQSTPVKE